MSIFNLIGTIFQNAGIIIYFYIQMYFPLFIIGWILITAGIIEYKEKRFLTVEDERKVI